MKLQFKEFVYVGDLIGWANAHKLDKEDIQNIIFDPRFNRYMLFYWERRVAE